MVLDQTDIDLLVALQNNSKTSIHELGKTLNLSKTPIYERIRRMEEEGIIEKYVAILDPSKFKTHMVVFCSVSLESQKLSEIEKFNAAIECIPEVVECYLMGGANDFLLKVIVKDLTDYHQFSSGKLAALPNVSQIKSTFVLNAVKHTTAIPLSL